VSGVEEAAESASFSPGDWVYMPGKMKGFVRSYNVSLSGIRYEVAWWINGELREAWFADSELERQ